MGKNSVDSHSIWRQIGFRAHSYGYKCGDYFWGGNIFTLLKPKLVAPMHILFVVQDPFGLLFPFKPRREFCHFHVRHNPHVLLNLCSPM